MCAAPKSPKEYLDSLPADRKSAIQVIRKTIKANIDKAFKEGIQYGMIGYFLPHSAYPDGYHCDPKQPLPFMSVASQKNYISIYLFCIYTTPGEEERFRKEWLATGKKLNMGKSCVRIKTIEDIPLEVLAKAIKRATAKKFVAAYEAARDGSSTARTKKKASTKKKTTKKTTAKKKVVKKASTKKAATKKAAKKTTKKKATKKATAKKATAKKSSKKAAKKKTSKKATKSRSKRT